MPKNVYDRNGIYWVSIRKKNFRFVKAIGTDLNEAKRIAAEKLAEAYRSNDPSRKSLVKKSFLDFVPEYIAQHAKIHRAKSYLKSDMSYLTHLKPFFAHDNLDEISEAKIAAYKAMRIKEEAKFSSINREISCLQCMLNRAMAWGYIQSHPLIKFKKFKEPRGRLRFLTPEEFQHLLSFCKGTLRDIVVLAVSTGFRSEEIQRIDVDRDVDFKNRRIFLGLTKNGDALYQNLNQTSIDVLQGYRGKGRPFEYSWRTAWRTAVTNAKLNPEGTSADQKVVFYTLRHTYASWLVMSGKSLYEVQQLMRHSTLKMTERYAHLAPSHLAEVNATIDGIMKKVDTKLLQSKKSKKKALENNVPSASITIR